MWWWVLKWRVGNVWAAREMEFCNRWGNRGRRSWEGYVEMRSDFLRGGKVERLEERRFNIFFFSFSFRVEGGET
jgi:hypothetical protein